MLRALVDFLWVLRRAGIAVATSQAIDAARVLSLVGLGDRQLAREALACVLVTRRADRPRFDEAFGRVFAPHAPHARDTWARLRALGFDDEAIARARELARAMGETGPSEAREVGALLVLLEGAAGLDHLLLGAEARAALAPMTRGQQAGYFTHRLLASIGAAGAARALTRLQRELIDALGDDVGARLADALRRELDQRRDDVRELVERRLRDRASSLEPRGPVVADVVPFADLGATERADVRRGVRALGERLRGAARVRERRAEVGGKIDAHATVRAAMKTGGVPLRLVRRVRRRDWPRLWVLCDISDSVRHAAVFLFEFLAVVHELFERTRTFVFVSEIGEATELFAREPADVAIAKAHGGAIVPATHNSNYGRAFAQFESRYGSEVDRRATLVVIGDGRTNYQPPGAETLARLRHRARAVLWLCPEPRAYWGTGDSAMAAYARVVTEVLSASNGRELEAAARRILTRR